MIRASWRRPSGPGSYQAGSSPPSPVFAAPPARWMPIVSAWCASGLSAPTLIAETTKRRTIAAGVLDLVERDGRSSRAGRAARRAARTGRVGRSRQGGPVAGQGGVDVERRRRWRSARPRGPVISPAIRGENRWASPSARNRAKPGSGRRGSRRRRARGWPARPRGGGSGARRGRPASSGRARPPRSGSSARRPIASRSTTSMSAPPMYDATALMPIRASVLRRPASNAATRPATVSAGRQRLGAARAGELGGELDGEPRLDRGRADGEDHGHGVDVEDVDGADRDVGPSAQAGRGQRGVDGARRRGSTGSAGARATRRRRSGRGARRRAATRRTASAASRSSAAARPSGPSSGSQVASSVARTTGRRGSRPRRAARRGRPRSAAPGGPSAAPRGGPPRSAGRRPSSTRRSITIRSRSGSMAGFVTWANAWRRWSATGRSSRPRPGGRRVVAHAPQRLVAFERHRLDVEPGTLGVEAGEVAQRRGRDARAGRDGRRLDAILVDRSRRRHGSAGRAGPTSSPRRPP